MSATSSCRLLKFSILLGAWQTRLGNSLSSVVKDNLKLIPMPYTKYISKNPIAFFHGFLTKNLKIKFSFVFISLFSPTGTILRLIVTTRLLNFKQIVKLLIMKNV